MTTLADTLFRNWSRSIGGLGRIVGSSLRYPFTGPYWPQTLLLGAMLTYWESLILPGLIVAGYLLTILYRALAVSTFVSQKRTVLPSPEKHTLKGVLKRDVLPPMPTFTSFTRLGVIAFGVITLYSILPFIGVLLVQHNLAAEGSFLFTFAGFVIGGGVLLSLIRYGAAFIGLNPETIPVDINYGPTQEAILLYLLGMIVLPAALARFAVGGRAFQSVRPDRVGKAIFPLTRYALPWLLFITAWVCGILGEAVFNLVIETLFVSGRVLNESLLIIGAGIRFYFLIVAFRLFGLTTRIRLPGTNSRFAFLRTHTPPPSSPSSERNQTAFTAFGYLTSRPNAVASVALGGLLLSFSFYVLTLVFVATYLASVVQSTVKSKGSDPLPEFTLNRMTLSRGLRMTALFLIFTLPGCYLLWTVLSSSRPQLGGVPLALVGIQLLGSQLAGLAMFFPTLWIVEALSGVVTASFRQLPVSMQAIVTILTIVVGLYFFPAVAIIESTAHRPLRAFRSREAWNLVRSGSYFWAWLKGTAIALVGGALLMLWTFWANIWSPGELQSSIPLPLGQYTLSIAEVVTLNGALMFGYRIAAAIVYFALLIVAYRLFAMGALEVTHSSSASVDTTPTDFTGQALEARQ